MVYGRIFKLLTMLQIDYLVRWCESILDGSLHPCTQYGHQLLSVIFHSTQYWIEMSWGKTCDWLTPDTEYCAVMAHVIVMCSILYCDQCEYCDGLTEVMTHVM